MGSFLLELVSEVLFDVLRHDLFLAICHDVWPHVDVFVKTPHVGHSKEHMVVTPSLEDGFLEEQEHFVLPSLVACVSRPPSSLRSSSLPSAP